MLVISLRVYVPGACEHSTSFSVCVDLHPLPSKGASVAFLATQGKNADEEGWGRRRREMWRMKRRMRMKMRMRRMRSRRRRRRRRVG